jgi:hypothetical protein
VGYKESKIGPCGGIKPLQNGKELNREEEPVM